MISESGPDQTPVPWTVYLLRCGDGTLYCGITNNLERRTAAHAKGRGARYTRGRGPFKVEASAEFPDKSRALQVEAAVKKQPARNKAAFLAAASEVPEGSGAE